MNDDLTCCGRGMVETNPQKAGGKRYRSYRCRVCGRMAIDASEHCRGPESMYDYLWEQIMGGRPFE